MVTTLIYSLVFQITQRYCGEQAPYNENQTEMYENQTGM